jgi:O-antigen/teichoic acid export membrane protein
MSEIVNSSLKTAVRGTTLVLFGTALSNLLWFFTKVLIIRNSTTEQLGAYSLMVAVVSLVSLVATMGVHEGATKYVSVFLGEGRRAAAEAVRAASMQIGIVSGLLSFAVLFLLSGVISRYIFYKPELEVPLRIISCYVPFNVLSMISIWILRGYGLIRPRIYYMEIGTPFLFFLFLCGFFAFNLPFEAVYYAYAMSSFVVFLSVSIYGYKNKGLFPLSLKGGSHYRQLLQFSLSILLLAVTLVVFGSTDTLMLGRYASSTDVGIYNISMLLASLLALPYLALGFVFMPLAADMFAKGQTAELKRTYQILTKWVFSASFPLFFVLFFFPEMTVTFLFGDKFIASAMPLRILSFGFMVQSFFGVSGILMIVLGLSRAIRRTAIFAAVMNILFCYGFIKVLGYGIVGASLGTMLSYILLGSMNLLIVFRNSGVHPFSRGYLKPLAISSVSGLLIYLVAKSLPLHAWMLPVYFVFFVGSYLLSIFLTKSIEKEEIRIVSAISDKTGFSKGFVRFIERFAK